MHVSNYQRLRLQKTRSRLPTITLNITLMITQNIQMQLRGNKYIHRAIKASVFSALLLGIDFSYASNDAASFQCSGMDNLAADGTPDTSESVKAFPGAKGWGANTRGGTGGEVVIVNTTKDINKDGDNLISLREALQSLHEVAPGPRTIVFEVGGLFELIPNPYGVDTSRVHMSGEDDSNITVACQTAPSPGVNIGGGGIYIWHGAHDQIWRHCTKRNSDEGEELAGSSHGFSIEYPDSNNMIFDHMSMTWASDGQWHVYLSEEQEGYMKNFTLSNSIVADGDANPSRENSVLWESSQGAMCLGNHRTLRPEHCSFIENYFAHSTTRNPAIWTASGEIISNIVYNWQDNAVTAYDIEFPDRPPHPLGAEAWIENNVIKQGPQNGEGPMNFKNAVGSQKNNYYQRFLGLSPKWARKLWSQSHGEAKHPKTVEQYEDIRVRAASADTQHMRCLGASKPVRDSHDQVLIDELYSGTGQIFNSVEPEERDYSIYGPQTRHAANYDTDKDGIADAWELRWSSNLNSMDQFTDCDADGYTDLEEFANELAICK